MKTVLFISNGYGEDAMGAVLLDHLLQGTKAKDKEVNFYVFPVVGEGRAYTDLVENYNNVKLVIKNKILHYGGMYWWSRYRFFYDFMHGGWQNYLKQITVLVRLQSKIDLIIGVGDILSPAINFLFFRKELYLVAVAYTVLTGGKFSSMEKWILKKYTRRIYTRDLPTAQCMQKMGINAAFYGFLGLDVKSRGNVPVAIEEIEKKILLLPGSRADWPDNLDYLLRTVLEFYKRYLSCLKSEIGWVVVVSDNINLEDVLKKMGNFKLKSADENYSMGSIEGYEEKVILAKSRIYGSLLKRADLAVGFAGTAMEQAVACGVPVIGPWRKDAIQANEEFIFGRQVKLLREGFIAGSNRPELTAELIFKVFMDLDAYKAKATKHALSIWGSFSAAKSISSQLLDFF